MELKVEERDALEQHLDYYKPLVGDARTEELFRGTVQGIISAESLICAQIAAQSPELAAGKNSEQRIRLMVSRKASTRRSCLNAVTLTRKMRKRGLEELRDEDEVWCIFDGSDLRKPYARRMEGLMRVRKLDGEGYTNGYRTLNVFGIGKKRRGILYHRVFSSKEEGFRSEPAEVQRALRIVTRATQSLKARIIHCMDSGFDDVAVWSTIWEAGQHLVCRLSHLNRLVEQRTASGEWKAVSLAEADWYRRQLATVETEMVVQKGKQTYAKRQKVTARICATPLRLTYQVNVRGKHGGAVRQKEVWLVRVDLKVSAGNRGTSSQMSPW